MMIPRKFKDFVRRRAWKLLKAKWRLNSGVNVVVEDDSDWFVFNEIFANREYDLALEQLLADCPPNPMILDLGANVGYFSMKASDELLIRQISDFTIISVEASPGNFATLKARVNQPLLQTRVRPYLGLAGKRTGSNAVTHSDQHYGHSATVKPVDGSAVMVDYLDIEQLINDDHRPIAFLKCDIEGSEEMFLDAYPDLMKRIQHAVFEFHATECNVERCHSLLEEFGFRSLGILKSDPAFSTSVEVFKRR